MSVLSTSAATGRRSGPLLALLGANVVSVTGNAVTMIAVPWFVLQTTGSASRAGVVAFFTMLPHVLSSFLSGVLVDRLGYRRISVVADLASGVTVALVPLLYATVGLEFWQLLVLVFLGAALDAPGETARESVLPDLAEQAGWSLERATSAADGARRMSRMLGAPLAGVLIALVGSANALYVDAATFLVSALVIAVVLPRDAELELDRQPSWDLAAGLGFIRRDPLLWAVTGMVMLTNMLDTALMSVLLPVYGDRVLDSSVRLGLVIGGFGAGAVTGSVVFAWIGHRWGRWVTFALAFVVCGPARYGLLAITPPFEVLVVGYVLCGLGTGVINPIISTAYYRRIPADLRGRVLGTSTAAVLAAIPFGVLVAGWVVELAGLVPTIATMGVVYLWIVSRPLRNRAWRLLDEPAVSRG